MIYCTVLVPINQIRAKLGSNKNTNGSTVPYSTVRYGTVRYGTGTILFCELKTENISWYSTVRFRLGTVQYRTLPYRYKVIKDIFPVRTVLLIVPSQHRNISRIFFICHTVLGTVPVVKKRRKNVKIKQIYYGSNKKKVAVQNLFFF